MEHLYGIASLLGLVVAIGETIRRGRLLRQVQSSIVRLQETSARVSLLVLVERLDKAYAGAISAQRSENVPLMLLHLRQWQSDAARAIGKAANLPDTTQRGTFLAAVRGSLPLVVVAMDVVASAGRTDGTSFTVRAMGTAVAASTEYAGAIDIEVLQP